MTYRAGLVYIVTQIFDYTKFRAVNYTVRKVVIKNYSVGRLKLRVNSGKYVETLQV